MTIRNKYFGQTAEHYDAKRRHSQTWTAETSAVENFVDVATETASIQSVLDIPCGTGRWIPHFQDRRIDYTGVDVSKDMLAIAGRAIRVDNAENTRILEQDCFQYLPAHQGEFDLTVSTRFLGWWDTDTAISILELLCGASKEFAIIHLRVHDNRLQVGLRRIVKVPKFVSRYVSAVYRALKEGRLEFRHNVFDIESHPRKMIEDRIKALGWTIQDRRVSKQLLYASVEVWLLRKGEAAR